MDADIHGVRATVIDLGLARMDSGGEEVNGVRWTPFDDEVFQGEGDYQFDVYRMMRAHIGRDTRKWDVWRPLTNVMVCLLCPSVSFAHSSRETTFPHE